MKLSGNMKVCPDLDDEPGGVELDACDELDINRAVAELAEKLAYDAVRFPAATRALFKQLRGIDEDNGYLALAALETILCAMGDRWPGVLGSHEFHSDVGVIRGTAGRALNDIAWFVAEGQRDALTRKHIEENT